VPLLTLIGISLLALSPLLQSPNEDNRYRQPYAPG